MKKNLDVSSSEKIILQQMEAGPMGNFMYCIGDAKTKEVAVVDPAWDVDFLCAGAQKNGFTITSILLTHGHPDHINGLKEILSRHDVPAYISRHETSFLKPRHKNIVEVEDRQKLSVGNIAIECILTPGHTPGSQCFWVPDLLITGDTLFIDGCGRCDLPGGNPKQMYESLYNTILQLSDSTMIYPGHNYGSQPFAALASLKKTNPYLTCANLDEFLHERMGV